MNKLEVLHALDLHGADLSLAAGKQKFSPLMTALMRWNVGVIDYLMERGVDPSVKDKYGFTAKDKAKIKQFRTIHSMLTSYEERYASQNP